jgi:hypothetical protein
MEEEPRRLRRTETHDLGMIIKDRAKVLRAHVEDQVAACVADFEKKLAASYSWDTDDTWKQAAERTQAAAEAAQQIIKERCKELGIPPTFAPRIGVHWEGRGENALSQRRTELRRVAKTSIEAMAKAAITKIEKQSLELRTQIVAMGLLTAEAKMFLESLSPIEESMRSLDFVEVEKRLEREQTEREAMRRRLGY